MSDYDVVVIGAGLGGLSAAAFMTKAGKSVLLLERQNVPGGYASSFTRGRFEFEISLHELSGLGDENNRGPLLRILKECGVADRVEFLYIPEFYRSVYPDVDIVVPIGRQNFEEVLCGEFPDVADGIKEFTRIVHDFADEALSANRVGMKAVAQEPSRFPTLTANFGKTLADVLNPLVPDEKARAVLGQIWGYYCQPPARMSFLIYALGNASYLRFGPAHIKGTSQALSQAFVDVIEERGGEVRLNNGAKRIVTSGGAVTGVVADDGTEISCRYVVSNANPVTACLDLIGPDNVPAWYLRRLGAGTGGASTFNVYLGLDRPISDFGLMTHETFVNTGYDLDKHAEMMRAGPEGSFDEAAVTAYNLADPDISPPGTAVVVITAIAYPDAWLKMPPDRYVEAKNRLADKALDLAERVAPGLRDHIEVVEVATPLTNMRYTGNLGGSIIGFDETYQGTGMARMPNRGPLDGLYFANAYTFIGGGYEPCIASGYKASADVLDDMERGGREPKVMERIQRKLEEQAGEAGELTDTAASHAKQVMARLHPNRVPLKVSEVIEETKTAKTLRLLPEDGQLPCFRAGQYVNLFVEIDGVLTSRPYSIASDPGKPYYDLTVRRVEGGFVSAYLLDRIKPGDILESTGPGGSFYYEPVSDTQDLVFLAGGSGITPFMSIIREAAEKKPPYRVHLIYGSCDPSDIIYEKELGELASKHPGLRVDFVISEPPGGWAGLCGMLDAGMISSLVDSVESKTFYICGPAAMYPLCEGALEELGVLGRRIKKEAYGSPTDVTGEPGWPEGLSPDSEFEVVEERSGRSLKARAGEPLMNSLERAGIVVAAVCRSGECTACRTRLLGGKVFAPARVHRRWSDEHSGYIHPCMSYPVEGLRIRI